MNWEFLKIHREGRSRQGLAEAGTQNPDARNQAEVRLLKPLDIRAIGAARETVRTNLDDFESALQAVSRLPDQFRLVMAPIENAVSSMALLRDRLEQVEENFAAEQRKTANLSSDLSKVEAEAERLTFAFRSEESTSSALRVQHGALEVVVNNLRQENTDLGIRLGKLEVQYRDTVALKDSYEAELAELRRGKAHLDDLVVSLKAELSSLLDEQASRDNLYTTLQLNHNKNTERLEDATRVIGELEATLKSTSDKYAFASTALVRERNAARALRTENEQLFKERDESKLQYESQIEAARARYDFVEKTLSESRARFQEETRQLSLARRERAERDREIGRLTLALEASQRDATELRAQYAAASESVSSTSTLLAAEIEQRRKLELDLDMLRTENSSLQLKQRSLNDSARSIEATVSEATIKFQSKIAQISAENAKLRAALNAAHNRGESDYDKEFAFLFDEKDGEDDSVVPIR